VGGFDLVYNGGHIKPTVNGNRRERARALERERARERARERERARARERPLKSMHPCQQKPLPPAAAVPGPCPEVRTSVMRVK